MSFIKGLILERAEATRLIVSARGFLGPAHRSKSSRSAISRARPLHRRRIIAQKKSGRRTLRSSARGAVLNHGPPYGDFTRRRFYPE